MQIAKIIQTKRSFTMVWGKLNHIKEFPFCHTKDKARKFLKLKV